MRERAGSDGGWTTSDQPGGPAVLDADVDREIHPCDLPGNPSMGMGHRLFAERAERTTRGTETDMPEVKHECTWCGHDLHTQQCSRVVETANGREQCACKHYLSDAELIDLVNATLAKHA